MRRLLTGDVSYLAYLAWQRWHRLDFSGVSASDLGFSPTQGHAHHWSGGPDLRYVLKQLAIPTGSRAVDLGSGKGASTFTLAEFFTEVIGVELSADLVKVAERNAAKLGHPPSVHFKCMNAAAFQQYDSLTYAYCFNAFPEPVMAAVLAHLRRSLRRHPRPFTIIYKYPGTPNQALFEGFSHTVYTLPHSHPHHVYCATTYNV